MQLTTLFFFITSIVVAFTAASPIHGGETGIYGGGGKRFAKAEAEPEPVHGDTGIYGGGGKVRRGPVRGDTGIYGGGGKRTADPEPAAGEEAQALIEPQ